MKMSSLIFRFAVAVLGFSVSGCSGCDTDLNVDTKLNGLPVIVHNISMTENPDIYQYSLLLKSKPLLWTSGRSRIGYILGKQGEYQVGDTLMVFGKPLPGDTTVAGQVMWFVPMEQHKKLTPAQKDSLRRELEAIYTILAAG